MRTIFCRKYQQEMEGLDHPPIPSAAGQKIFETVSKAAWLEWIKLQTMLINEGQLNSLDPNNRAFLKEEREKFLSNAEDVASAAGYVPIEK